MDIDLQEFPQNSICMTGSRQETNHKTLFAYPVLAKMDIDLQNTSLFFFSIDLSQDFFGRPTYQRLLKCVPTK